MQEDDVVVEAKPAGGDGAEGQGKPAGAPGPGLVEVAGGQAATLAMMPFVVDMKSEEKKLATLDRWCLNFLRFVVTKRRKAFWCVTGGYVFLTLCGMVTQSLVLSPQYQYAWIINEKRSTKYRDMRLASIDEVDPLSTAADASRQSRYDLLGTWIEYKGPGGTVFTPALLKAICDIEALFYGQGEWRKVCMVDAATGECAVPELSVLRKFYGDAWMRDMVTGAGATCDLLDAAAVDATWEAMRAAANASVAGLLDNGIYMEQGALERGLTTKTRSLLYVGQPLEGYDSTTDDTEKQLETYLEFFSAVEADWWDHFDVESTFVESAYLLDWSRDGVDFRCFAWLLQRLEWLRMQGMDSLYMLLTICFVGFWVRIHTGSCAYTAAAMSQILMSIPITAFFYRVIFRFEYFAFLHLCSVFFVLGIGADDNFVILDAWKQAMVDVPVVEDADETTLRRLVYSFSRAMEAVFNTSFTTASAFLCLGLSPLMPVRTFGIFAAMVVIMNYIMVLTMIPTCMLVCENGCCLCPSKPRAKVVPDSGGDTAAAPEKKKGFCGYLSVEPFFEHVYLPAMKWSGTKGGGPGAFPLGAALCAGAFLGLGVFNFWCAGQLEMPEEQEEFFPAAHMFSGFLADMQEDYLVGAASEYAPVYYTFGVDGLGTEDYNEYEPDYKRGFPKWTDSFNLYSAEGRAGILQFCAEARTMHCGADECALGLLHLPGSVSCFYEEFEVWKATGFGGTASLSNATEAEFYADLLDFRSTSYPGMVYGKDFDGSTWKEYVGVVGGDLKYVTIPTYLTMKLNRGIKDRKKVVNRVIKFTEAMQSTLPREMAHLSYDGGWQFLWCDTFIELRASLFEGFYICFPIAFGVLIFATENILVSLYSIVGIAFVVASVLGTAQSVFQWDLGIIESLAGVMVIGFSVDYTIHLGHMYVAADKEHGIKDRIGRFAFSIEKMGPTVVGGAATTLGAGAFMLPCQLQFFFKLGLLIFTTILYSFLFAFGFVMPLLAAVGPSGDQFSITPAKKALYGLFTGRPK